jgi:hypothetical protein
MMLPNIDQAEVPESKIVLYLLSLEHKDGKSKAQFFREFGFEPQHWKQLIGALKRHATRCEVASTEKTEFGMKYVIDGELETPSGARPNVRVVWFVEAGEEAPRLVTDHPLARKPGME